MSQRAETQTAVGFLQQATQSVPVTSKTFKNYLTARERAVEQAKAKIEKFNSDAYKKIKKEKVAEKEARDRKSMKDHELDKRKEKTQMIKKHHDVIKKDIAFEAHQSYKQHLRDLNERGIRKK